MKKLALLPILASILALPVGAQTEILSVPAVGGGGGSGTVESVGLSAPAEFTVSGSPVTTTGTLTFTKASQLSSLIWAAPCGSNGVPTFRALCAGDIPSLDPSKITGTAVITSDSRLSDARTPTAHASTHASAGSDPVTLAQAQITNLTTDLAGKQAADADLTDLASNGSNGSGAFARVTSPTFTTPNIGTATGSVSGNAGTATALAANPADCTAPNFARTIAANGDLGCAAIVASDLPNTAVTPATYTNATVTVDAQGRITSASNGSAAGDVTTNTAQTISAEKTFTAQPVLPNDVRQIHMVTMTGVSFVNIGASGLATAGSQTDVNDSTGHYVGLTTTATNGNTARMSFTPAIHTQFLPDAQWVIKTDASISNVRIWTGLGSTVTPFSATSDDPADMSAIAFGYSTATDGTAFWRVYSNNGSGGGTRTATSVAIATNTRYIFRAVVDSASSVRMFINGTLVATLTTELPGATTPLGFTDEITTLENAAKTINVAKVFITNN